MKRITTPVGPLRTQARSDAEGGGPHPIAVELHPEPAAAWPRFNVIWKAGGPLAGVTAARAC